MLGFRPKLPINDEQRDWLDEGFCRLDRMLGNSRLRSTRVILPTDQYFPDHYDRSPAAVERLFCRVCDYLQVDRQLINLEILPDEEGELRKLLPYWDLHSEGCAGLYFEDQLQESGQYAISLHGSLLNEPLPLIATMAHELGHAILLGGKLIDSSVPDHEPMTDLLTVYLGFGIFSANCAALFKQFQDERRHGWSMRRLGYLSQEEFGYALARFASERGDLKPDWVRHLTINVRTYFKRSAKWLAKNPVPDGI